MIPFDFTYFRPDTLEEAFDVYRRMDIAGRRPLYYGGGTEIISMARAGSIETGAVIDVKAIPACNECAMDESSITLGAAVTLSHITETNYFPLMSKAAGRIADHTIQCRLTLGGNLAGTIIYRESVLPLLLTDAIVETFGARGLRRMPIGKIFDGRMNLGRGEFIVRVIVDRSWATLPFVHAKKAPVEKIGYPVATVCALKNGSQIRVAVSGVCGFPFRSQAMENALNEKGSHEQRARNALGYLPAPPTSDQAAGGEYRKFVLCHALIDTLIRLENRHGPL